MLWLWCRPVATAPITPLAWEPPYAEGTALKRPKKKKKKESSEVKVIKTNVTCYYFYVKSKDDKNELTYKTEIDSQI